MDNLIGIAGSKRNACVAVSIDGQIRAACEQERLSRVRAVALHPSAYRPRRFIRCLRWQDARAADHGVRHREPDIQLPRGLPALSVDYHEAHAATSFLTSPF